MTAGQLSPIFRHVSFALILCGLLVSEFLNLRAFGMVLAIAGIAGLGAWAACAYLNWEYGE